jgi:hypothetical protein
LAAGLTLSLCGAFAGPDGGDAAADLPHNVQFELGKAEFAAGDSITIESIHGTSDAIAVGETYSVDGTYTLNSRDEAQLAFYATTIGPSGPTPVDSKQHLRIKKGTGSFHLVKTMREDGYLHVSFYPAGSGGSFGGVYFGQGNRVLRSWGSSSPAPASSLESTSGPNQALLEYLGNPVVPPAAMDARYTKDGLINAVQTAARNAGIKVKRVAVDDSEFPFVVDVICEGSDFVKLKEQIRKLDGYDYSGSIGNDVNHDGSDTCNAFNLVPYQAYPSGTSQQIYRRLWLRQQVFYDKLNGQK